MMHKKIMKFRDGGKAEYPIRIDLDKAKRDTAARDRPRPAPLVTQRDLDRHSRMQKEEAGESGVMKKAKRYAAGGVTKVMPTSEQMGNLNMAKGGVAKVKAKAKAKVKAKGKPFAATKFGAAMMKKSGDTEGRAMKKMAKGGSIDGIATKGKTKGKMMAMGGMAGYKHGGKTH
jgi:hypothetical protein